MDYYGYDYEEVTPKDKGNSVKWNSMKKGLFDDSKKRTLDLISEMRNMYNGNSTLSTNFSLNNCKHVKFQAVGLNPDGSRTMSNSPDSIQLFLSSGIETLEGNPNMLVYTFTRDNKLLFIDVHSHVNLFEQMSTDNSDICEKACNVYAAIEIFLDVFYSNNTSSVPRTRVAVRLSGKLSDKCNFGSSEHQIGGGSKSRRRHRRKPVRKTRRGRGRTRKSKAKSKTHRRRRHSRVRKHKKNTYTRRR
jgi:hypothetical protein